MESPFNEIEPRTAGGNTVHVEPRMALEPAQHRGMFMGRVVVPDQVQRPGRLGVLIEQREEPQPFLMAMPTLTCPDQLAREGIERGKQGRVPCRLESWVIVAPCPFFKGSPSRVRSGAWI